MSSSSIYPTAISTSYILVVAIRSFFCWGRRWSIVCAAVAFTEDYGCSLSDAVWVGQVIVILWVPPLLNSPFLFVVIFFFIILPLPRPSPPPLSVTWRPILSLITSKPYRPSPILGTSSRAMHPLPLPPLPFEMELMTNKESGAAAPSGEASDNPMMSGSHPDLICRHKDLDMRISWAMPIRWLGRAVCASSCYKSKPPRLRFRQQWQENSFKTPRRTRCWRWYQQFIGLYLVVFVLVDAWMLFFRKYVDFMSDIHMKYICRSAVEIIETHYFFYIYVFWWHRVT